MRLSLRIAAGLAVVALIATAWLKYYREGASERAASAAAAAKSAESEQTNPRPLRYSQNPPVIGTSSLGLANAANSMSAANATNSPNPSADSAEWEGQIDNILADESNDDVQKSGKLLALMPKLPPDGQVEAITHAANLLDDDNYRPLSQIITNALVAEDVLDVLMSDLANRTNALKFPTFLQIARQEKHPMADEAKNLLELYLDEDHGTDWAAWDNAIKDWLKEEREGTIPPDNNF
ncbi:MAG: hypothetical protein DME26_05580 [Verrucomicrobia bacterium]|nr:MAG: hypothetical protein DME26_05580 [Verrucomicrobiota bacterium]